MKHLEGYNERMKLNKKEICNQWKKMEKVNAID